MTPETALAQLLRALFSAEELRVHLSHERDGGDILADLPGSATSLNTLITETIGALSRRGLVDHRFFDGLEAARPRRTEEIRLVRDLWHRNDPPAATTTPGPARPVETHVVTLEGSIGGRVSLIDEAQILEALGGRAPLSRLNIDLNDLRPEQDDWAWTEGKARIDAVVQGYLRHDVLRSPVRHISIFGLAPIPWLMALGYAFSETIQTRLFTRLREPASWSWQPDAPELGRWTMRSLATPTDATDVALLVSASAEVQPGRVDAVLPPERRATYTISLDAPRIDAVRSEQQLAAFGALYRQTLDEIERRHRSVRQIHLFGAVPVAIALDCGRRLLHNAPPPVMTYHFIGDRYVRALELRR